MWLIELLNKEENYLFEYLNRNKSDSIIQIPLSYRFEREDISFLEYKETGIPIGSIKTIEKMNRFGFKNIWLNDYFNVSNYSQDLSDLMLNYYHHFTTESLLSFINNNKSSFNEYENVFIRPDSYNKVFDGQLISACFIPEMLEEHELNNDERICVALPKYITQEWRVVVGETPIASSEYRRNGGLFIQSATPPEVIRMAELVRERIDGSIKVFIADICRNDRGEIKLLEINSFNTSGFYACDPQLIVQKVEKLI